MTISRVHNIQTTHDIPLARLGSQATKLTCSVLRAKKITETNSEKVKLNSTTSRQRSVEHADRSVVHGDAHLVRADSCAGGTVLWFIPENVPKIDLCMSTTPTPEQDPRPLSKIQLYDPHNTVASRCVKDRPSWTWLMLRANKPHM